MATLESRVTALEATDRTRPNPVLLVRTIVKPDQPSDPRVATINGTTYTRHDGESAAEFERWVLALAASLDAGFVRVLLSSGDALPIPMNLSRGTPSTTEPMKGTCHAE